ncbi:MAG TPA: hypothetical protein DDW23_00910 [Planctomycetes bacterium]|nr:hypothetical protein [Planctomycetota bacterium]
MREAVSHRASKLPSLVTLANLACGICALILCMDAVAIGADMSAFDGDNLHPIKAAAWLLVLATFLDAMDGKLARLTRNTSTLGAQLDSLADAVAFGVVPGMLVRSTALLFGPLLGITPHPRILWVAPIVFTCCAVLRLARFNVENSGESSRKGVKFFTGLPTPAAAGLPVAMVLFTFGVADSNFLFSLSDEATLRVQAFLLGILPFTLLALGALMVTRVPYPHLASWLTRNRSPFQATAEFVLVGGLLLIEPEAALLLVGAAFVLVPLLAVLPRTLGAHLASEQSEG